MRFLYYRYLLGTVWTIATTATTTTAAAAANSQPPSPLLWFLIFTNNLILIQWKCIFTQRSRSQRTNNTNNVDIAQRQQTPWIGQFWPCRTRPTNHTANWISKRYLAIWTKMFQLKSQPKCSNYYSSRFSKGQKFRFISKKKSFQYGLSVVTKTHLIEIRLHCS